MRDGWLALVCETSEQATALGRVLEVDVGSDPPDRRAGRRTG
jgi:hypothetical protein